MLSGALNRISIISQGRRMMSSAADTVRSTTASGSQVYESKRAVFEYLQFHYGSPEELFPFESGPIEALKFPERCARICQEQVNNVTSRAPTRALDVGCAVGASVFELARHYNEVVGVDFSQHFIDAANTMKNDGKMQYETLIRGKVYKKAEAKVATDIDRSRVSFVQGDACNLSPALGKFDLIFASNLLCRLPKPKKFLAEVASFLNTGGSLVLISPYSWLEEYTTIDEWIGATPGSPSSADAVDEILRANSLVLSHRENIPFLIREHERKFQYGVSDCTVWKKA